MMQPGAINYGHQGTIAMGGSWSMVVTEGADYYCSIHVVMKGKLTVE